MIFYRLARGTIFPENFLKFKERRRFLVDYGHSGGWGHTVRAQMFEMKSCTDCTAREAEHDGKMKL